MGIVVSNNVLALNAQHSLGRASSALSKSLEHLSTGFKINRGADGPAALVISEKQRAQIAGLQQAIENSEKAVTMVQTAEGALAEINSLLVKVRSLALDSANEGVNDSDALTANQAEITNALETINRIANNTQFGTKKLLDGSLSSGTISNPAISSFTPTSMTAGTYDVTISAAGAAGSLAAGAYASGLPTNVDTAVAALTDAANEAALTNNSVLDYANGITLSLVNGAGETVVSHAITDQVTQLDDAVDALNTKLSTANAGYTLTTNATGQIAVTADDKGTYSNNAYVQIAATDVPGTTQLKTGVVASGSNIAVSAIDSQTFSVTDNRGQTLTSAEGTSITVAAGAAATTYLNALTVSNGAVFQVGPNANQTVSINMTQMNTTSVGVVSGNQFANLAAIDVTSTAGAQDSVAVIDQAIDDVTTLRSELGAFQANTLESGANNLRMTLENTVAAESLIRDTDFADEIAEFTKQQILQQTSVAVLQNANQVPQLALSLLQG